MKINTDLASERGIAAVSEIKELLCSNDVILNSFRDATEKEAEIAINSSSASTSDIDPIPSVLVKKCKDIPVKPLSDIINKSLRSGVVPRSLKEAVFKPLIKKTI